MQICTQKSIIFIESLCLLLSDKSFMKIFFNVFIQNYFCMILGQDIQTKLRIHNWRSARIDRKLIIFYISILKEKS